MSYSTGCGVISVRMFSSHSMRQTVCLRVFQIAVPEMENPVEAVENLFVMAHDDNGGLLFLCDPAHQVHHHAGALRIECRRGFVGQNDTGTVGHGAGNGHALASPPETVAGIAFLRLPTPR